MNEASKLVKADKIIRWGMTFSFLLLLFQASLIGIFYLKLPPILPLFNQLPWGDDRLGTLVFFLFNYFLLRKLYITMPLISRIIGVTTLLAALLSFIFIVRTLQLIL
jgi:uncharacterized BrkB/YihY/UPF0761 family membrane protein